MPTRGIPSWRQILLTVTVTLIAQAIGLVAARTVYFMDDAPFFFRYAEHIAQGYGYRWNVGESPIWGASAPLWPLLLAGLVRLGVGVETAAIWLGAALTLAASTLLAVTALRLIGMTGALAYVVFSATNFKFCFWATQGMETPLSYLLVALGLAGLCWKRPAVPASVVAGLSLVHKLDFAPFGVLVLVGAWIRTRRFPWYALGVSLGMGALWYGFALSHFGSPIPNALMTKLQATYGGVAWHWFLTVALLDGGRKILLLCAMLSVPALWPQKQLLAVGWGLIAILTAGYTISPPAEAFEWYAMPIQPALCFLAAAGTSFALRRVTNAASLSASRLVVAHVFALVAIGAACGLEERRVTAATKRWVDHVEQDRSNAGRWVAHHTPADATVLTGFGNVAYYGQRYVYDRSYLNRPRPAGGGTEDFVGRFRPDVIVECYHNSGIPPLGARPTAGYRVARVFDVSHRLGGIDFYVVVMLRQNDAVGPTQSDARPEREAS